MTLLPETLTLGPEEEAARLWKGATRAHESAATSLVSLCESLNLGIRAAEILAIQQLQKIKDKIPATIAMQLETPAPALEVYRDAVAPPRSLQFTDILDLLSEPPLECVSPGLHRGWEDRRYSCERSRRTAQEAVRVSLSKEPRDSLLQLSAYRNRIFRIPPPIRVVPREINERFQHLANLIRALQEQAPPE